MPIPTATVLGTVSSLTTLANVNHEEELERLVEGEEGEEEERGEEEGTRQGERREEGGSIILRGEEERGEDEGEERGGRRQKERREEGRGERRLVAMAVDTQLGWSL